MVKAAQRAKLSRMRDQRRAMLKGLAESLITHESIVTTKPKAKALRPYIEKLVTRAKDDNQHNRRQAMKKLSTKESLNKLFTDIGPRFNSRNGGYTRIEPNGWRRGDDAEMARISFVETESTSQEASTAGAGTTTQNSQSKTDKPTQDKADEKKETSKTTKPKSTQSGSAKKTGAKS